MSSGVGIPSESITTFEELKLGRRYAYITYRISPNGDEIIVDHALERAEADVLGGQATFEKFEKEFPIDEGRFAVIDMEFDCGGEGVRSKLVFLMWAPTTAGIRSRMLYACSKRALRQRLDGIHTEVQATDPSELAFEAVFEQVAPKGAVPVAKLTGA
ncbi:hypothetical protein SpCBS45565_g04186 [Spizellomyces sp. 'palustris']|nr:hypothetical protein SpCBS45565_g04186 [Spizellomyces sp. 'palustris']